MIKLKKEHIIALHEILLRRTGGEDGIRDIKLLESAIEAPFAAFAGVSNHPTVQKKAARLAYGLIKNHPFVDGNKRVGILAMMTFLELNGIVLTCKDDDIIAVGLGLADGSIDEGGLIKFIYVHTDDAI